MSRAFRYRQIPPPPEGVEVDYDLARKIHDRAAAEWGESVRIKRGDGLHWFIKGLAACNIEGAAELDSAIDRMSQIELFVVF